MFTVVHKSLQPMDTLWCLSHWLFSRLVLSCSDLRAGFLVLTAPFSNFSEDTLGGWNANRCTQLSALLGAYSSDTFLIKRVGKESSMGKRFMVQIWLSVNCPLLCWWATDEGVKNLFKSQKLKQKVDSFVSKWAHLGSFHTHIVSKV